LFKDPSESSDLVTSNLKREVDFPLYFVPAFHGLRAPLLDTTAAAGIIGKLKKITFVKQANIYSVTIARLDDGI
jgi:glycerol kinase